MSELLELPVMAFKRTLTPSPDIGEPGNLVWIPLELLRIDPSYQRDVLDDGKKNIGRIAVVDGGGTKAALVAQFKKLLETEFA